MLRKKMRKGKYIFTLRGLSPVISKGKKLGRKHSKAFAIVIAGKI